VAKKRKHRSKTAVSAGENRLRIAVEGGGNSEADAAPLVVGVGASAGGLEAFSQLLRGLPENPGFALVFVQHMDPHHVSALVTLLASSTTLPVSQPTTDTHLEADHVYVVPPNRVLTVAADKLIVQPRPTDRSQYTPIDTFFQSLAQEHGPDSIAVILAGTGSDGSQGIQAIDAAGGTILVQEPESAKQDGMPRAAIATGKCDYVLRPQDLAEELVRLARCRPHGDGQPQRKEPGAAFEAAELDRVFALLRAASGVDFGHYKLPTLQRRIQRRIALHKLSGIDKYIRYLEQNPAEINHLYQDILIHVTRFFREPNSFRTLAEEVFPAILAAREAEAPVRIWVPACSTGEEPYSVAMTLMEALDGRSDNVPIQIFATDISETSIEQARSGVYPPAAVEELPPERLKRFFTRLDGQYRINKSIRDVCVFARQDLTRDPPFSKLDLIVCRNVLIYLGQPVQHRLIGVFHYALRPTGYLMLGSAETIGQHLDLFTLSDKKHRLYRKRPVETPADMEFAAPYRRANPGRAARETDEALRGTSGVQGEANRLILNHYSPPGVIVNDDMRIVHFRGQTGRFLEPAPGDASLNLLKMCREGLLHGLRTALQAAKKKDAPVRRDGLRVKANGDFINVAVEVVPLGPSAEGRHYLIMFRDAVAAPTPLRIATPKGGGPGKSSNKSQDVERLQRELIASREYLQANIQDLEAANEELQSANEEILSANEELQSTNEELDTAKEELQSTNEELNTVNEELNARNEELARTNSDLINLLNGVQIAIVIVSRDLRIRRFTPIAERVLNLIPGDIGRPIGQIKPNIECPDLDKLVLDVIDTMNVQQREVSDSQGRLYSLTIRPYKNTDNRIDGAVLVLLDVDELRRNQQEAQLAREYAEAVLGTVREALVVLDADLRVQRVNRAFMQLFRLAKPDVEGRLLYELGGGEWDVPDLRRLLGEVLPRQSQFEDFEVVHDFHGVGRKRIRLNARRISSSNHRPALILLAMEEVSETSGQPSS